MRIIELATLSFFLPKTLSLILNHFYRQWLTKDTLFCASRKPLLRKVPLSHRGIFTYFLIAEHLLFKDYCLISICVQFQNAVTLSL